MHVNKSLATNLLAILVTIGGYFSPIYSNTIYMMGLFALSGGVTNWLAIYMLFEKVPFLYGSGVIPNRFEDFKLGIKNLIIKEFFNKSHMRQFFKQSKKKLSLNAISQKINFDKVFEKLKDTIATSSLGGMLNMIGGKDALDPLKEPVIEQLKSIIQELASNSNQEKLLPKLINQVEDIIDKRLKDLTPDMVKRIIQDMIRKHLGWLVVWGGVFGGLIGLVASIF